MWTRDLILVFVKRERWVFLTNFEASNIFQGKYGNNCPKFKIKYANQVRLDKIPDTHGRMDNSALKVFKLLLKIFYFYFLAIEVKSNILNKQAPSQKQWTFLSNFHMGFGGIILKWRHISSEPKKRGQDGWQHWRHRQELVGGSAVAARLQAHLRRHRRLRHLHPRRHRRCRPLR